VPKAFCDTTIAVPFNSVDAVEQASARTPAASRP